MSEIKKKYNHCTIESELLKKEYFQKFFTTKKNTNRDSTIIQLPITISKDIPLATISDIIKEDVVAKYETMKGNKTKLIPLFDTEEKNVKTESYQNLLIKAGIFFDIDKKNITYSEKNTNFVRNLFVQLVEEWRIYEDCSINYRSIQEQKTLSTEEIERKKTQIKQYNIRYFIDTKNISLIVPTTFPETLFADVALAVHPDDKRYKKIIKNKVIIPIINKAIPIITDESVDPTKGTGIMRITPAHDKKSLIIAQKNWLEINRFAIDKNGCFTETAGDFQGKNANEFIKNIIKNLDDIHNLESTNSCETEIATNKKTWEKARPLLCNQLFIKTDKEAEYIQTAIQEEKIQILPEENKEKIENIIHTIEYRPVTKEDAKGYSLPFWKSKSGKKYFIADNHFFNLPTKKTKNKYTVLSIIMFNLLVDRRIKSLFSIEECIDVLLGKSRTGEQTTLEAYIELFSETLPRWYAKEINDLKKIIEYTEKDLSKNTGKWPNTSEKFSDSLTHILEKSIAITNKKKWWFTFDIDTLVHNDEGLIQQQEKIEENLGNALIVIKTMESVTEQKKQAKKRFYIKESKIFELFKTLIIGYNVQKKPLFDICYIQEDEQPKKKNKDHFKQLIKDFWTDCTRLYAIDTNKKISDYDQFINKLRNASRFIHQHLYDKKWTRKIADFEQLTNYIEKRKNNLSDFESWIVYKIVELQKEYEEYMSKHTPQHIQEKVITVFKEDFCDKYLEIQKHQETENGNKVTLWCLGNLLKLLHPFVPFISQKIRDILEFEGALIEQKIYEEYATLNKNYKIQLFMDIIEKFLQMKNELEYAKHETIDICFFAPLDFLQFLRTQENILSTLINAVTIEYLENERDLNNYHTESIINITIWIKTEKSEITKIKKENLQEVLEQKEQELQRTRTILSGLSANGADEKSIQAKKKEMTKIKEEIENIQYEIQKQKINK